MSTHADSEVSKHGEDLHENLPATNETNEPQSMDTKEDQASKPNPNTVIMFDWDDTLLASSFLSAQGFRLDSVEPTSGEVDVQLRALEQCVCSVLQLALRYGHVNIVTNAETGWVQLSAQKFMPLVVPFLSKVTVISARSTFESLHPDQPLKWKFYAFHERLTSVFGAGGPVSGAAWGHAVEHISKNIISFGDSHVEREAIRAITRGVRSCRTKSVKFAERPTPEQLRRQLELVTNCFQYIHNHDADLDLQLTVTLNSPPSSPTHSPPTPALPTTEVA